MSATGLPRNEAPAIRSLDGFSAPIGDALLPTHVPGRNRKRSLYEKIEAGISRLSTRNNFWHRLCSLIWLPYAFHSGIRMKKVDAHTFVAILPFRRFNRNWYNAMAGAALLGNTEIAAGFYIFGVCGGDYTVVCKHLNYKFLRPCLGPAIYRIKPREDIHPLMESKKEFNLNLEVDIIQMPMPSKKKQPVEHQKERRVGKCDVTFHVTPKLQHKVKAQRHAGRKNDE